MFLKNSMRRGGRYLSKCQTVLILTCLSLAAGCSLNRPAPEAFPVFETIEVTRESYVPLPSRLTAPQPLIEVQLETVRDSIEFGAACCERWQSCERQMEAIRRIQEEMKEGSE